MKAFNFINSKQKAWAIINNIPLIGSDIDWGEKCYTKKRIHNFYREDQDMILEFKEGERVLIKSNGESRILRAGMLGCSIIWS